MASSEAPATDFSSLFSKKKGKKGKKPRAYNLNLDSGITRPEETPKIVALNEILGGPDPSEDDGWAEVVEKKSVVATGGKQVAELIDMTTLMNEEESTARKLEKQDIKKSFHEARIQKDMPEPAPEPVKEEEKAKDEAPKSKGLSGDIFGGGAARGGWQARMHDRELKQREAQLSVDNAEAFPSLANAMSGPVKPKQGSVGGALEGNPWGKRGGGSAAAAAIRAALGGQIDATPPDPGNVSKISADEPPATQSATAPESAAKPPPAPPVWVAPVADKAAPAAGEGEGGQEKGGAEAAGVEGAAEGVAAIGLQTAEEPPIVVDKDALVQQFGKKKKKKKKKPTEEEPAGGEP